MRAIDGLDVLDERICGSGGVADFDPLRLAVDVRGTGASGYEIADWMREDDDVNTELAGENVVVAVFGMGEPVAETGARLVRPALARGRPRRRPAAARARGVRAAAAVGPLALRRATRSWARRRSCPLAEATGRVAAESLAAYPPGIPNVLPGERLSAETLEYVQQTLEQGGYLRGASDRRLRTLRVVIE